MSNTVEDTQRAPASASTPPPRAGVPIIPHRFYVRGTELARGGMGRISLARDTRLERDVAIKEMLSADPVAVARFDREVRLSARLQHPSIVTVYEAGCWETGESFYAMRLVNGRPLSALIAEATTRERRLALLPNVLAVAQALAYAHEQRIIHRDLKPHNVLVGVHGETVVIDWGLAKDLDDATDTTRVAPAARDADPAITTLGIVLGTPSYMPPEQARGEAVDARADVYAIGAILYHVLAGRAPYAGVSLGEILDQLLLDDPPALAEIAADVPADLVAIVARAMHRDPARRFATASELAEELRRYSTGQLIASHAYSVGELVRRFVRRHRVPVAVVTLALAVVIVVGVIAVRAVVDQRDAARHERTTAQVERGVAQRERVRADLELANSEREQGRALLLANHASRALPLLAEAFRARPDDFETAILASDAVRGVRRHLASFAATTAAFSPDGATLALAPVGGGIALHDATTGAPRATVALAGPIGHLTFAPDGTRLAAQTTKATTIVGGDSSLVLPPSNVVRWLASGAQLVLAVATGAAVFDAATGARVLDLPAGEALEQLALSADERRIAGVTRDRALVWDRATGARVLDVAVESAEQILLDATGERAFITGGTTMGIEVWSLATKTRERTASAEGNRMTLLGPYLVRSDRLLAPPDFRNTSLTAPFGRHDSTRIDDTHVAMTSSDDTLGVWDIMSGMDPIVAVDFVHGNPGADVWTTPGGRVATLADDVVDLWDVSVERPPAWHAKQFRSLAVGGSGGDRLVASRDYPAADIALLDREGRELLSIPYRARFVAPRVRPHSDEVFLVEPNGPLAVRSLRDGAAMRTVTAAPITTFAFDDAGTTVVATDGKELVAIAAADGAPRWRTPLVGVRALAVAGDTIFAGLANGDIACLGLADHREHARWRGHTAEILAIAIGDDIVISGGADGTARIWDRKTGAVRVVLEGHRGAVGDLALAADGRWLATAGNDNLLRLWNPTTGDLVRQIVVRGALVAVAFADDHTLYTATSDGYLERIAVGDATLPVAEVARIAATLPWKVVDGRLVSSPR